MVINIFQREMEIEFCKAIFFGVEGVTSLNVKKKIVEGVYYKFQT